jgi:hypothetical protein
LTLAIAVSVKVTGLVSTLGAAVVGATVVGVVVVVAITLLLKCLAEL